MAESEEELKNLSVRLKRESERASLKLNFKKKLRSWHLHHYFMANRRRKGGSSDRFPLLGL